MSLRTSRCPCPSLCAVALSTLLLCEIAGAQAPVPKGVGQALLDPLTAAERRSAERLATADGRVRELIATTRTRLVYVEWATDKPEADSAAASRLAEVLHYRYEDDSGVRTLVDLTRKEVRAVERVEGNVVPLAREDLDDAVKLALDNAEVKELLGEEASRYVAPVASAKKNPPYAIRALLVHSDMESDPCFRRRCVHLFFQRRGGYLIDSAIVDLRERRARVERGTR